MRNGVKVDLIRSFAQLFLKVDLKVDSMLDLKKHNILEIYSLFFQNIFQCKINKDLCLGVFYITIHIIYVILVLYNVFFTFNFVNTFILIIIVYLNALTVFLLRTCPIILLEKHYTNTTCLKSIFFLKKDDEKKKDKDKDKDKKNKVLSKYLDYDLDEFTLQGVLTLGLILVIKILILSVF